MRSIHDDATLVAHLSRLKANAGMSTMSATARKCFDELYDEARDLIAKIYNAYEAGEYKNAVREYIRVRDRLCTAVGRRKYGQEYVEKMQFEEFGCGKSAVGVHCFGKSGNLRVCAERILRKETGPLG